MRLLRSQTGSRPWNRFIRIRNGYVEVFFSCMGLMPPSGRRRAGGCGATRSWRFSPSSRRPSSGWKPASRRITGRGSWPARPRGGADRAATREARTSSAEQERRGGTPRRLCEAMSRPTMRFVPVKTAEQQAALMLIGAARAVDPQGAPSSANVRSAATPRVRADSPPGGSRPDRAVARRASRKTRSLRSWRAYTVCAPGPSDYAQLQVATEVGRGQADGLASRRECSR